MSLDEAKKKALEGKTMDEIINDWNNRLESLAKTYSTEVSSLRN